ncbi:MAG: hypothetical protein CMK59_08935 [Proteobacteria bacterium]|nr:hypothetical protein [Pseudomonadota bacterium]
METVRSVFDHPVPHLLMIPDFGKSRSQFLEKTACLNADELAVQGWNVVLFDPAGRGDSWGNEDWGGEEHQTEVAQIIDSLSGPVGIYTEGAGLNTALGGAQRSKKAVDFIIDYEGIADPDLILRLPIRPDISADSPFWNDRNGHQHLKDPPCLYHRFQSEIDHNLPDDLRHARRIMRTLSQSKGTLFRLNHHRIGEIPDRPRWIAAGPISARRNLLEALDIYRKDLSSKL